ncbi:MAG: alpha-keto acid decarboxylase family protein [Streptosporangiaceae bacterium]|nr:alpha-keto acid decarboxylase family protein [Streptosporangiaceae bacterium]
MHGSDYTVGNYLADRLVEAGLDRVFGIPGDYTMTLLDYLVAHPGLAWTGCANELNAGYAADGYARMRGIGALCTTFGVGELSALNAVAGSFAEHVPVVHIVGSPASGAQAAHRIVHHSLGDGVFNHFADMYRGITCAQATLTAINAAAEIDRVLVAVKGQRLPGYILVPAEIASAPATPPAAPLPSPTEPTDPDALEGFTAAARQLLGIAPDVADVVVLSGLLAHRFGAVPDLARLLAAGPLPHATTLWGKSVVDESDPHFAGIYAGAASAEVTRQVVEDAAVLIIAGVQFTDLNSGFFTQQITRPRTIEIGADAASVGAALFSPVPLRAAIQALIPLVAELATRRPRPAARPAPPAGPREPLPAATPLGQEVLWDSVARALRPGDVVLADQGTSFYGAAAHRLPRDVTFIGQPLWASIGYTLPALLGACLADPERRGVLLIGDGAGQLTVQELSTILHAGLSAVLIVVDNNGYTTERAIHGPTQPYNNIARWDWTMAPALFGSDQVAVDRVATAGELDQALAAAEASPGKLALIQAVVPPMDVPELLAMLARAASQANAQP